MQPTFFDYALEYQRGRRSAQFLSDRKFFGIPVDATYTSKRGAKHHGYKMHIAIDLADVIKDIRTTTAKVHDSQMIDELTRDETKAIFADSGYMSKKRKRILRSKGVFGCIIERRVRGQSKLRTKQSRNNQCF